MKRALSRRWDFPAVLILTFALLTSCQRLVITGWTSGLGFAALLTLVAILLGLPLGASRFRPWTLVLLALGYSLVLLPMLAAAVFYPGILWMERMASLGGRLAYLVGQFAAGQELEDTFLFVIFLSLVYWIVSLASACTLTRRGNFLGAVLPAGILLTIIQLYDRHEADRIVFLAIYVFLGLLLLGRLTYLNRRSAWQAGRVRASNEANASMNIMFMASALALVSLAWLTPASNRPWQAIREFWKDNTGDLWEQTSEELNNATAGLDQEAQIPINSLYGNMLILGQQAPTENTIYFRIMLPVMQNQDRYYWRARVYDEYRSDGWRASVAYRRSISPTSRSLDLPEQEGLIGEFTVNVIGTNIATLVTPSRPVWISRPAAMTYMPADGEALDPILFQPNTPVMNGEEYLVHAILSSPTVLQLRSAGTDYPAWVSEHYLQLPEDLPPVIADLARELTAGAETPYDKAEAITNYLRDNMTYSLNVPLTPNGRDPLAYFLFERRTGFCNHYATAEVIMLRAVGVPARLAVGFAEGQASSPGWRTVRARDAHAWPEVYFPGVGWVEFEPTSSEAPVYRPSGEAGVESTPIPFTPPAEDIPEENPGPQVPPAGDDGAGSRRPINSAARIMLGFGVIVLLVVGVSLAYTLGWFDRLARRIREIIPEPLPVMLKKYMAKNSLEVPAWLEHWAYVAGLTPMERAFRVVYRALGWLGVPADPARTPAEAAALLETRLPEAGAEIRTLLAEYERNSYSRSRGKLEPAQQSGAIIRKTARLARRRNRREAIRRFFTRRD